MLLYRRSAPLNQAIASARLPPLLGVAAVTCCWSAHQSSADPDFSLPSELRSAQGSGVHESGCAQTAFVSVEVLGGLQFRKRPPDDP